MRFQRTHPCHSLQAFLEADVLRLANVLRQILRLETKLKDLHSTDLVATRRALASLQQHVEALKDESEVWFYHNTQKILPRKTTFALVQTIVAQAKAALATYSQKFEISSAKPF